MPRATSTRPLFLALLFPGFLLLSGCTSGTLRESGTYPDGSPAWEREYLLLEDGRKIAHGAHATWYPAGTRRTLALFRRGRQEGYAFAWSEDGRLSRMALCVDDRCRERPIPEKAAPRAAEVLALTRFR